jgi:hypothetical protein
MPDASGINVKAFWKIVQEFLSILSAKVVLTNVNLLI